MLIHVPELVISGDKARSKSGFFGSEGLSGPVQTELPVDFRLRNSVELGPGEALRF